MRGRKYLQRQFMLEERTKMLQIAVCDDEKSMGDYLKQLIERRLADEKGYRVKVFSSGAELLKYGSDFDIFFLDIDLKDMSGIEMAKSLRRESEAVIVFVTALKEYVFDAFDVSAFHYLLKPILEEKFTAVFERAVMEAEKKKRMDKRPEQLFIRRRNQSVRLDKAQILYVESRQRKVVIHTLRDALEIYATMSHMEKELGAQFYRCHRGYLVNLSQITGYTGDTITLCGGEAIYLAKDKYNEFVKVYMRYLRDGGTVCV